MSREIDERVVEMRFDNKQFEQGAESTLSILDKLKQALKMDGATEGMDKVEEKAGKINLAGMGTAVENVQQKFSALETIAVGALLNIGQKVSDLGIKMVKELSVDRIMDGFNEYELKMGSVQTIMASTGEDIKTVNGYLEELNAYSDRTIYSFSDMTNNIGKFTNNGVKLEDAVSAIKGISNAAAVAGANSAEASRAMYNFSQALSAGSVKLIDWKSIQNANMATTDFKQNLIDTAVAMGTLVKEGDMWVSTTTDANGHVSEAFDANKMFNESLSAQWMTTEVLVQTLQNYSADVENMTEAEREAYKVKLKGIGYTDEQIDGIVALSGKAYAAAQDIKTFSQLMDTLKESVGSGWAQTFEILFGNLEEAKKLWTSVNKEIDAVLSNSSDFRNGVLEQWVHIGGKADIFAGIRHAWEGLKAIVKPITDAYRAIFFPFDDKSFIKDPKKQMIDAAASKLADVGRSFRTLTKTLRDGAEKVAPQIERIFKGVFALADIAGQAIGALMKFITPGTTSLIGDLIGYLLEGAAVLGDWAVGFRDMLNETDAINRFFQDAGAFIKPLVDKMVEFKDVVFALFEDSHFEFPDIAGWFKQTDETVERRYGPVMSILTGLKDILVGLFTAATHFAPMVADVFTSLGQGLSNFGGTISSLFSGENFQSLFDLVNGGMLIALGMNLNKFLKSITNSKDQKAAGGFLDILKSIPESLTGIKDGLLDTFGSIQETLKAKAIKEIAVAIGILAASLFVLSLIDSKKLTISLGAVTALFAELLGMVTGMSKLLNPKDMVAVTAAVKSLQSLATAVLILGAALNVIAAIDPNRLEDSMKAVTILLAELTGVTIILSKFGGKVKTGATSIIAFAIAIRILAGAVAKFGEMEWAEIAKGLVAVGVLLTELAGFAVVMKKFGKIRVTDSAGILIIAAALEILQNVAVKFGQMPIREVTQGVIAIGALLIELAAFAAITKHAKHFMTTATGMIIMGAALEIMCDVVAKLGGMNYDQLIQGAKGIAIVLVELAAAALMMKGSLGSAVAMTVMAASLEILYDVVNKFGNMHLDAIITGLVTLAVTLGIVIGAGALAMAVAPGLFALAGAVALLGVGVALLGVGVVALGAGLASLAVGGTAAATSLVAMLEILTVGLLNVIRDNIKGIGEIVVTFIRVVLEALKTCVPELVETVLTIFEEVLRSVADHVPTIVVLLADLLIGVFDALTAKIPDIMFSIVNFVTTLFSSIIDAFRQLDIGTITDFLLGVGVVAAIMLAFAGLAAIAPAAAIGIAEFGGLVTEFLAILALLGALDQIPGFEWLIGEGAGLLKMVGEAIGGFFGGIVAGFAEGVSSSFPQIGKDLSDFMTNAQPFIDGATKIDDSMLSGVKALAEVVLILTAAEILNGLASWLAGSKASIVDFGKELAQFGPYMNAYAASVKGLDGATVEASANAAKMLAEMAKTLPNNGGLAGAIFGENSISEFGKELAEFGPFINMYAMSVKGLDTEAVEASVYAATMLADMANNLPNNGGLSSLIFGDNKLSDFGAELAAFGPYMATYAESIKDLDGDKITASAAAAQMLVDLANALPNTGGIVSWFTGDNDIGAFGNSLAAFGSAMSQYYVSISGIDTTVMNAVIDGVNDLIDIATRATTIDTSGMERFGGALWTMGDNGIQSFIDGFYNATGNVKVAINGMIQGAIDQINAWNENFKITGANSAVYFENGVFSKLEEVQIRGRYMANSLVDGIKERFEEIKNTGILAVTSFTNGIQTKIDDMTVNLAGIGLVNAAIDAMNLKMAEFNTIGQNIGQGLANGIRSKKSEVEAAAREVANAAKAAMEASDCLDIHSPSRALFKDGSFAGEGFVNGLLSWVSAAGNGGASLAKSAMLQLSEAIAETSDLVTDELLDPVITPVLDLSNVMDDISTMTDMFNNSVNAVAGHATVSVARPYEIQNGAVNGTEADSKNGNTYNFIQNNSSPKALSRSEIYRQTRNQFAQFTEAVGRA